mmetsp:Transcript_4717/g.13083  ORF Transcript_4717/g.13083 Transcript_4717/m.13083 type:complete len:417 (-) Transcript_4717:134-1384(-)|eukprot:CAMPEP_0117680646 /NCGR_PEP_ID=MMETSP0804-20121206/18480_1 /TAXON_ID=1074897 /ORGANISM="Tetraselmis astigmatica, Strain CCMP880" /LENGTH=416 /DNA_ID=CAMNT_0005490191 /DNA_START=121 /DNA_END=1371 /DNA_ORIENTATION=-
MRAPAPNGRAAPSEAVRQTCTRERLRGSPVTPRCRSRPLVCRQVSCPVSRQVHPAAPQPGWGSPSVLPAATQQEVTTLVDSRGRYTHAPLEKDSVTLAVVQSRAKLVMPGNDPRATISRNLEHVCALVGSACEEQGTSPDIILLHEFPLTGYLPGDREAKQAACIELPGPESEALGELAREHDAYLVFGAYAKDSSFPGHVLNLTTVLGRDGEVAKTVWKPRNIKRFYPGMEIPGTTVESLYNKFVEKYGMDDIFPVLRTEFGNLAASNVQMDPFVMAAFSMKGAEILLRTSTLFSPSDVAATALTNNVYSAMSNIATDHSHGGRSMVVDPAGNVMGQLGEGDTEGVLFADIPIAEFREGRRLPHHSLGLTGHVFREYVEEIPLNHMDLEPDSLPKDEKEMKAHLDQQSRWLIGEQ